MMIIYYILYILIIQYNWKKKGLKKWTVVDFVENQLPENAIVHKS